MDVPIRKGVKVNLNSGFNGDNLCYNLQLHTTLLNLIQRLGIGHCVKVIDDGTVSLMMHAMMHNVIIDASAIVAALCDDIA